MRGCLVASVSVIVLVATLAAACTGHYTELYGTPADAPAIDAANICKGDLYDPCVISNPSSCKAPYVCQDYAGAGLTVCTESCVYTGGSGSDTCPLDMSGASRCNMKGL